MTCVKALSIATLVLLFASFANAAPIIQVVNGIPSFDTNLGTLLSVTVTLDPPIQMTEEHSSAFFENLDSHAHFVDPLPIPVAGLDTYDFLPTLTSFENPGAGQDHAHSINLSPIVETYTGSDLAWFLDPLNGVGALNIIVPPTSPSEGHQHAVNLLPVLPTTRFTFEPTTVPEPMGALLLACGALAIMGRRR